VPVAVPLTLPVVPEDHTVQVVAFAAVAKPSEASPVVKSNIFIKAPYMVKNIATFTT
jgi:hypothetical protein